MTAGKEDEGDPQHNRKIKIQNGWKWGAQKAPNEKDVYLSCRQYTTQ